MNVDYHPSHKQRSHSHFILVSSIDLRSLNMKEPFSALPASVAFFPPQSYGHVSTRTSYH